MIRATHRLVAAAAVVSVAACGPVDAAEQPAGDEGPTRGDDVHPPNLYPERMDKVAGITMGIVRRRPEAPPT
ncbi:hypothetical protein [Micromonospora sp. DH14]|uniref:hypothetical protein n=1 Tax=Micromonospora sp. DH14 TaxID=3040120 RepID=UPI002442264B|nr:hypothetical protein [Micromonospora sp. DH14]MDG9674055.1 hypothetical protein [Micromonospora sp. DH14]